MRGEDGSEETAVVSAGQMTNILAVIIGLRFRSEEPESPSSDKRKVVVRAEDWDKIVLEIIRSSKKHLDQEDVILQLQINRRTKNWVIPKEVEETDIEREVPEAIDRLSCKDGSIQSDDDGKWYLSPPVK